MQLLRLGHVHRQVVACHAAHIHAHAAKHSAGSHTCACASATLLVAIGQFVILGGRPQLAVVQQARKLWVGLPAQKWFVHL